EAAATDATRPDDGASTAAAPASAPAAVNPDKFAVRKPRVLLVEDNPVNLMVGQRLLGVLGITCDTASNGEAALLRLSASRYDIVLMDCQMPVMDGYTATRRWRENEAASGGDRHLPIIAMTANAMAGDRQKCLYAGMDDYLPKPVTRSELERCLHRWWDPEQLATPAEFADMVADGSDDADAAAPTSLDPQLLGLPTSDPQPAAPVPEPAPARAPLPEPSLAETPAPAPRVSEPSMRTATAAAGASQGRIEPTFPAWTNPSRQTGAAGATPEAKDAPRPAPGSTPAPPPPAAPAPAAGPATAPAVAPPPPALVAAIPPAARPRAETDAAADTAAALPQSRPAIPSPSPTSAPAADVGQAPPPAGLATRPSAPASAAATTSAPPAAVPPASPPSRPAAASPPPAAGTAAMSSTAPPELPKRSLAP